MKLLYLTAFICPLLLTGCYPTYQPPDVYRTVPLNTENLQQPLICTPSGWKSLQHDKQNYTKIPYGERVTIGNDYSESADYGYVTRTVSCFPSISFVPKTGEKYYADFLMSKHRCGILILKYSNENKLGLIPELSMQPTHDCNADKH